MKVRNVGQMNTINDAAHSRSLIDSLMMPELISALTNWSRAGRGGVLIGGAALSFHVRPRMTQDIDILFLGDTRIPETVPGFSRISRAMFRHEQTGVEVNVVTPSEIQVPPEVAEEVAGTALVSDGVRVASEGALVALKLFRLSYQDRADIVALIKTGRVDLLSFPLPAEIMSAFRELLEAAATDPHPP
jgi:hypothetical protein